MGKTIIIMKKNVERTVKVVGGALVGFINGFFGGGGGMLCVPLLEKVLKVPTKKAHATAILIILPISVASAVTYIINGYADWGATLFSAMGVVAGGVLGAVLLQKLKSEFVALVFSIIMIVAGAKLMFF